MRAAFIGLVMMSAMSASNADGFGSGAAQQTDAVSFETDILPILRKNCLACHSASEKQGSLVLESTELMQRGGEAGAAIVPGRSDDSLLLKLASHQQEPVMPPEGNDVAASKLTPQELQLIKHWIDQGARSSGQSSAMSPRQMSALPSSLKPVNAIALTEDGQVVAFSRGNRILLHHVATGRPIAELADPSLTTSSGGAHQDLVQSLALNADGDVLASGGFREAKIWRRPKDVQTLSIALGGNPASSSLSADKSLIAVAGPGNTARIFKTSDGAPGVTLNGHSEAVTCVRFFDDGTRVVTGSVDKTVRIWNATNGLEVAKIETPAAIHAIELVPLDVLPADAPADAPRPEFRIVTGHADNMIRVWSLPTAEASVTAEVPVPTEVPVTAPIREIGGHGGLITALVRVPAAGKQVFAGSMDSTVRRWNIDDGQQLQYFGHGGAVTAVAVSPDGQKLAATSDNHTARLWKIDGQQIAEMRGDIRRRAVLIRAQQQESAANTRLNVAKQLADAADRDVPVRTDAERRMTEQLTTATADVQTKKTMVDTTLNEKLTAEKAAIYASTTARAAMQEQRVAEQTVKQATAVVQTTQARLGRIQQTAGADPSNESLKQRVAATQTELDAANQQLTAMTAAVQAPTTKAAELANVANQAAQKLDTVQRPWSDATVALRTAEAALKLLTTQQTLAAAELKTAQDRVPIRKEAVTQAEAALTAARAAVQTANEQQQQADLAIRSVAFSTDGKRLATGGDFPGVHLWDAESGAALESLAGHTAPVRSVEWLTTDRVMSTADDQSLRQWDASPGWILERTLGNLDDATLISHRVTALDLSPDATQLLVGSGVPSRNGELSSSRPDRA